MHHVPKFTIGDLVSFDVVHAIGIIIDIKKMDFLDMDDHEYLVLWENGEEFWCLDVTLKLINPSFNNKTN